MSEWYKLGKESILVTGQVLLKSWLSAEYIFCSVHSIYPAWAGPLGRQTAHRMPPSLVYPPLLYPPVYLSNRNATVCQDRYPGSWATGTLITTWYRYTVRIDCGCFLHIFIVYDNCWLSGWSANLNSRLHGSPCLVTLTSDYLLSFCHLYDTVWSSNMELGVAALFLLQHCCKSINILLKSRTISL